MTSLPFVSAQPQPLLPLAAPAPQQFSRLLDALLILEAEGSCQIADLAARVGLAPVRMRELLSAFMLAGAEVLGTNAPFNLMFGTSDDDVGTGEEDDDKQAEADVVHLSAHLGRRERLLSQIGARPLMVRDVARALVAARLLRAATRLPAERRAGVGALTVKLAAAMQASVGAPAESVASVLLAATQDRQRVRFRYLHPWTGQPSVVEVEPYDVRRRRDRLVLDAAGSAGRCTYDLGGISELVEVGEPGAFAVPDQPQRGHDRHRVEVVLRVPAHSSQENWLFSGWGGQVVRAVGNGEDEVRIQLEGDAGDPDVAHRLGVLLLQLGRTVRVVNPPELRSAAADVARNVVERHGG